jgi:hypothetical protein
MSFNMKSKSVPGRNSPTSTPFIALIFMLTCTPLHGRQHLGKSLDINGYVQGTPVRISTTLPGPLGEQVWWDYRVQNRLNLRWFASDVLSFTAETRTRFFAGDLVRDIPGYANAIDTDTGYLDLSVLLVERSDWFAHFIPDRLFGEYATENWNIRVGRQRVNWGINTLTNPNDLFNIYSLYDFDYPERPGADAVRVQHFLDWSSRMELAWSPNKDWRRSTLALMYAFNRNTYDIQILAAFYDTRFAVGGGWAGNVNQTGFKGEVMLYYDTIGSQTSTNLVAAVSMDYMFSNSLFAIGELVFNSDGGMDNFSVLGGGLRVDNPTFSRYQFTTSLSYPFSPLFNGGLTSAVYPDDQAMYVSPSFTLSLHSNLDFIVLGQWFLAAESSVLSDAGSVLAATLKWNF